VRTTTASSREPGTKRAGRIALILAILLGSSLGVSGYTFRYAEGGSYLSSDPAACVNCHIMRSQYDSWQKASHHTVATCVDCHLPASGLRKWIAKGVHGYRHSKAFTFQDFVEPIRITPGDALLVQENCMRCHADLLHDQVAGSTTSRDAIQCVHCHSDVGHGEQAGLGGSDRDESHETSDEARR
jgi:cytochrome c nitrite reductase small subunit